MTILYNDNPNLFDNCLEDSAPYCVGACPFHMEIRSFIEKAKRGSAKAAFNIYRDAVGFPRIVNAVCPHPCQDVCPGKDFGGAVQINRLEQAVIHLTKNTSAADYYIPAKQERVAVIGAGAAGLGAVLRLAQRGYQVEVFDAQDKIGGYLQRVVRAAVLEADLSEQLGALDFVVHLNHRVESVDALKSCKFNAVIVATGDGGDDFGLISAGNDARCSFCAEYDGVGWFAVGGVIGQELIDSLAAGLEAGGIIDGYLKTGRTRNSLKQLRPVLREGMVEISPMPTPVTSTEGIYSKEELMEEAERCIECRCDYCRRHCDLCEYTNKWPRRIKDEIMATTLEGTSEIKATPAKRLISLCNQCGLCGEVCPESIDMDALFMMGRQKMYRQHKMPWAFHDYYRRDMEQANGDAALIRKPICGEGEEEYDRCTYAFFPGCQMGAADPQLVFDTYELICSQFPDTAIFLQCCGIAAEWEGDVETFRGILEDIRQKWEYLGKPTMILACMNCYQKFVENIPAIPVVSLYEALCDMPSEAVQTYHPAYDEGLLSCSKDYSIFDPCTARHEDGVREAVRTLARRSGAALHSLKKQQENIKCCGYGGHGEIADKNYTDFVAQKRIEEGRYPYITYCMNCRDVFRSRGKDAAHILELMLGKRIGDADALDAFPTISERQQNRLALKQSLLETFWKEQMTMKNNALDIELQISEKIKRKLSEKRIFEYEIEEVIAFCQRTGRTLLNAETGTLTGYKTIGHMTYWVEYRPTDEMQKRFQVINVYSHRVKIELEAVWNGVRTEDEV